MTFTRPVDPETITPDTISVVALGEALEGRITPSSDGTIATFFPDVLLPAATQLSLNIDGANIMDANGRAAVANGDGTPGGALRNDFSTATLTRIENTNVEGFIFDANYTDDDGLDIPLEGVVVSVIGLPDVTAVTDENGRFLLENLPIPKVFLDFDASNVTNRSDFDYDTIVKPVDTVAGQTVGLSSGEKAFNIYFAALAEGDYFTLAASEQNEVGVGEKGLANLTELFPNIDPAQWEKLKVTIPADSLTTDDGSPVNEVSVMAFPPTASPPPCPKGSTPRRFSPSRQAMPQMWMAKRRSNTPISTGCPPERPAPSLASTTAQANGCRPAQRSCP